MITLKITKPSGDFTENLPVLSRKPTRGLRQWKAVAGGIVRDLSLVLLIVLCCPFAYAHFEEVHVLIDAGRYTEANNKLEALAESAKDIAVKSWCYYQIGEIHYNYTHQYNRAIQAYDKILKLEKSGLAAEELFLAIIKKGDVHSRMGNYQDAIQTYDRLIKLAPASHFVHKTGLQKIRDINNALADLREQQRISIQYKGTPLAAIAQFQIAELYRNHSQLNQPEKAIEKYSSLLEAHPNAIMAPEARWRIAYLRHTVLNQSALAMATYRKVVEDYPTSNFAAEALFQMANIHRIAEKYSLAIPVFEKLKQRYPNFWNMHAVLYWTGVCYEKILNYPKAIEAFETFHHAYLPQLDPGYLGQISMHDKSVSEVKAQIEKKIEELAAQMSEVELERLNKASADRDFSEALSIARHLIATSPYTPQAEQAVERLPRLQQLTAIENLREKLQDQNLAPIEAARARLQIGTIYERKPLQDYPKAIEAYQEVLKYHAELTHAAEALYRSGRIYAERLSTPNEAIHAYKKVIETHPNTLQAMMANFQLGELYRGLHRYNEALQAYETTIGYPERDRYIAGGYKDSFADRAQFRIGRVHYEDRRYNEARFAFEEFIQNRTQSPRLAAAYVYLAAICENRNENAQAAYYYKRAEDLLTDNPVQMTTLIEEASVLGNLQVAADSNTVMQFIKENRKRLATEKAESNQ
ncbi:tetratricopeptide repeat protein [Candidatus Poribacteria bacterium]|nr:tetratricopeptide repeat protein [Candidatus Poribacteria bacterium]